MAALIWIAGLICAGFASSSTATQASPLNLDLDDEEVFASCRASRALSLPLGLPAAVMLAERHLNLGSVDIAQDALLRLLLSARRDPGWWSEWAKRNERIVQRSLQRRAVTGKWPVDVTRSGYLVSFGRAQITPRAALRACRAYGELPVCAGGERAIVQRLLGVQSSIWLAGAVIATERRSYCALKRKCSLSASELATLYNVGVDLLTASRLPKAAVNRFGRWAGGEALVWAASQCRTVSSGSNF